MSAGARDLLPGDARGLQPKEPYRQLWYAAAIESLRDVQIEQVTARPRIATNLSLRIPAGGARLISVEVPTGAGLVLGINGTPLMEMTVFGADGAVRAAGTLAGFNASTGPWFSRSGVDHQRRSLLRIAHLVMQS